MSLSDAQEGLGGEVKEEEEKEGLTMNDSPIMHTCTVCECVQCFRAVECSYVSTPRACVCTDQSVKRDSPQVVARSNWPHCLLIHTKRSRCP